MICPCPEPQELLCWIDGEVTENRGAELRAHLMNCRQCTREYQEQRQMVSRLAAPIPGVPSPGAVQAIMRRLDSAAEHDRRNVFWRSWAFGAGGLAAAALVVVLSLRPFGESNTFQARGAPAAWAKKVGVDFWILDAKLRKLTNGEIIGSDAPFVASYRNLEVTPAYLMAFAVDAGHEIHWLYPAFDDPRTDPSSVPAEAARSEALLPDSVVLEGVPAGPLRIVSIVSAEPLRVSSIETLLADQRDLESLRKRWPMARVEELLLRVAPSPPEPPKPRP